MVLPVGGDMLEKKLEYMMAAGDVLMNSILDMGFDIQAKNFTQSGVIPHQSLDTALFFVLFLQSESDEQVLHKISLALAGLLINMASRRAKLTPDAETMNALVTELTNEISSELRVTAEALVQNTLARVDDDNEDGNELSDEMQSALEQIIGEGL
jgi:hypothetical protein